MRVYASARRGACIGACVLALGVAAAEAQQAPIENPTENAAQAPPAAPEPNAVTPSEQTTEPATSNLPELVVNDDGKKKKKVVKAKQVPVNASSTNDSQASESTPPPPGVTLGSPAKSDTGTTTFDAKNVQMRTDGGGDANTFMRNLPNVQYQNNNAVNPGATSTKTVDTKPALLSISGGRTYENNIIIDGVSTTNIMGVAKTNTGNLDDSGPIGGDGTVFGVHPQTVFVPAEFVGKATVIDSNASAEYGQFQGGVVLYELAAPPTDRYHASVSASRDSSDFANYVLATPNGDNPTHRDPPKYVKDTLSVSIGAPITSDFAFIAQASRKVADSSQPKFIQLGGDALDSSENMFFRFAATAKTDIGKFTFDTKRTDYFQHWEWVWGRDVYLDVEKKSQSTKLEYETGLPGLRMDSIGLGAAKLTSRAYYNTELTENNSPNMLTKRLKQVLPGVDEWGDPRDAYHTDLFEDWCHTIDPATYSGAETTFECYEGGFGHTLLGQDDYGVQATLTGALLLGSFTVGTEVKNYDGRSAQIGDYVSAAGDPVTGTFVCAESPDNPPGLCTTDQYMSSYLSYAANDISASVLATHTFAQVDQTWNWFNLRAGVRHDYDDYLKNNNFAPRLVGTVTPFDGLSFSAGYNRYYLGETLYYAVREHAPAWTSYRRGVIDSGTPGDFTSRPINSRSYVVSGLNTPYRDEYTGAIGVRDPLFQGQWRLRYLERYGRDQFGTESCNNGDFQCYAATNGGEDFYRSASAEYTKEWNGLRTAFGLDAAAITGNVTWSEQHTSQDNYLLKTDFNGDGGAEASQGPIWYRGQVYQREQFQFVTGNLDIPVRFGATLATVWWNDLLELNVTAGVNLGFEGVYLADEPSPPQPGTECEWGCDWYVDRKFNASLKLDVNGQINVTEQAAIQFSINNITNSTQQTVTTEGAPWVLGRSYWLGSALRF